MTELPVSTCTHQPGETQDQCFRCSSPVCQQCSLKLEPQGRLCFTCARKLVDQQQQQESPRSLFVELPESKLTLGVAGLLVVLYLLSALPTLSAANLQVLKLVDLNIPDIIFRHQLWRLITANLFHADLSHIGSNLVGLILFGHLLEQRIGPKTLLVWMFAFLLGSNIVSMVFLTGRSIGFSGVDFGLQAAFVFLTGKIMIVHRLQEFGLTLKSLGGYFVLIVLINLFAGPHINFYGHLGGAGAGILCALIYPVAHPMEKSDRIRLGSLVALLVLAQLSLISYYAQKYALFKYLY